MIDYTKAAPAQVCEFDGSEMVCRDEDFHGYEYHVCPTCQEHRYVG